jgi:hypothetical protein
MRRFHGNPMSRELQRDIFILNISKQSKKIINY